MKESIQEFVRSHVKRFSRGDAPAPAPQDCLLVVRVAKPSVASAAGIAPGDWLVEVDGVKAATLDPVMSHHLRSEQRYRFYSPSSSKTTILEASGIPIGVEMEPTAEAVAATFDPGDADTEALYRLWELGEWSTLLRLATADLEARVPTGFVAKLARKADRNTPSVALAAAALYEHGREDEARTLFEEYLTSYAPSWTQEFEGLADYYLARDHLKRGAAEEAAEAAHSAHLRCSVARTARLVEKITGRSPPLERHRWLGERFPIDYALPEIEGRDGIVSLIGSLDALNPRQVLLVCLLANYRGNGPYDGFMRRFRTYLAYFPEFVSELHVITMTPERRVDRAYFFEAEDTCRREGLPFHVLLEDGAVTEAVEQTGAPAIFVIDASGTVVEEGPLREVEFWHAFTRLHSASA